MQDSQDPPERCVPSLADVLTDGAAPVGAEQYDAVASLIAAAGTTDELSWIARRAAQALARNASSTNARLVSALVQEAQGEASGAATTLLLLAREWAEAGEWDRARWLARRGLKLRSDHRFVRLLLQVGQRVPDGLEDDLQLARECCPDAPELLWYDSNAAEESGDAERAAQLATRALRGFVAIEDLAAAEDALLRALGSQSAETLRQLIHALPDLARAGANELLEVALELGRPRLAEQGLNTELVEALERVLERGLGSGAVRAAYVEIVTQLLGGEAAAGALVRESGLADPSVPFPKALAEFKKLSEFRPGMHVRGADWGVGKVRANDARFLTIDFADRPGHRMSLEVASRSIAPLSANSVAAALFDEPETVLRERDDDPVALLVRALRELGGEGSPRQIRDILVGQVIAQDDWPAWWKKARDASRDDPRLDHSQAYRDTIRLSPPDTAPAERGTLSLPLLDLRQGIKKAAATIARLVEQHPDLEPDARARYMPDLARAVLADGPLKDRIHALPLLAAWCPERSADWARVAEEAIAQGLSVTDVTAEQAQLKLLEIAAQGALCCAAASQAIASRFESVRARGWELLAEHPEAGPGARVEVALTDHAVDVARRTQLAADCLERWHALPPTLRPSPWSLLIAVVEGAAPSSAKKTAESACRLMAPSGPLSAILRDAEGPDRQATTRMQSAVRRLGPAARETLDRVLHGSGHPEVAAGLTASRVEAEARKAEPLLPERDPDITLMTRRTYSLTQAQLAALRSRLETVLQDLDQARGFGDISENAEYDTAREQRAMLISSIERHTAALDQAAFIEDLEPLPGVVAPGTEVVLRSADGADVRTIWLLGEGDGHLGDDVVSYRAPLGQALLGRREGDTVSLDLGGAPSVVTIESVRRRLPSDVE